MNAPISPAGPAGRALMPPAAPPAPWTAWIALSSAGLAWLFDAMDLQIFTLILFPSVSELIGSTDAGRIAGTGGVIIACKFFGWGSGGIAFGVIADHIGRARTMLVTVVIYSLFTALSGLAQTWWQLAAFQALAGVGMGGEWAAGAALVAETWPEQSRVRAMQLMQMCFALGFFAAAALNLLVGPYGWRWVFAAGAAPAPIIVLLRLCVPEPARWLAARNQRAADTRWSDPTATLRAIFAPDMRRRTIVAVLIALAMMAGSNSLAPLISPWVHQILPRDQQSAIGRTVSQFFMMMSIGGLVGYLGLMWPIARLPRRWVYAVIVVGSTTVALTQFISVTTVRQLLLFAPIYGFFAIGGFGFFAVYFPELFPTAIRATGQGFCWNMARSLAALGPLVAGALVGVMGSVPAAGRLIAFVYLVGFIAIWFGPETKGEPLQD
ncbi:MAG: MFS transporter [Alphaproteobacteria bacterium]|nr:MFS transporter [Alphaproteobacteria bacterium]